MVAQASTGREAIQLFRTHRPDVTLMDLRLPDMSGIDVLSAIVGEFPNARIVMLTTFEGDVEIQRSLALAARPPGSLRGARSKALEHRERRVAVFLLPDRVAMSQGLAPVGEREIGRGLLRLAERFGRVLVFEAVQQEHTADERPLSLRRA